MSSEDNKAIVSRFFDILGTGDLSDADEIVAEDYVNHNPIPGQAPGRDGFIAFVTRLHMAFPDLYIKIEEQIAEGNRVVTRYQVSGTHQVDFMGAAGTARQLSWPAITVAGLSDGQVKEIWLQWDRLAVLQQLGVVPPPAEPEQNASVHRPHPAY